MVDFLRKKFNAWWPAALWAGLIFSLSSQPRIATGQPFWTDFAIKKTLHVIIYFVLFLAVLRGVNLSFRDGSKKRFLLAASLSLFYGVTDELHQTLVPTREGRLRDVVFDTTGIFIGLWLVRHLKVIAPAKLAAWARRWLAL